MKGIMRNFLGLLLVVSVAMAGCGGDDAGVQDDAGDAGGSGEGAAGSADDGGLPDGADGGAGTAGNAAGSGGGSADDGGLPDGGMADGADGEAGTAGNTAGEGGGIADAAQTDTGTPLPGELIACDVTAEPDPCTAPALCSGTPWSGFYCREACPAGSQPGDACGDGGICLEARPRDDGSIACFELADCDYVTAAGCDAAAGQTCAVVDFDPLRRACVPAGDLAVGERCDATAKALCAPGAACLGSDIEDGDQGTCTRLCHPGDALPDGCVECIGFSSDFGSCAECSVVENDCDTGEACYPISEALGGICVEFGPGGADDLCTFDPSGSCREGFLCAEMNDPSGPDPMVCVQTCDPANPVCDNPDYLCNDIGIYESAYPTGKLALCRDFDAQYCMPDRVVECPAGLDCMVMDSDIGICLTGCDPTDGAIACDENHACLPTSNGELFIEVFLHGNGICGTGCTDNSGCGGETCLLVDGLEQPGTCGTTCDTGNPACTPGLTCVPTPQDAAVGACVLIGGDCDPSAAEDPCAPGSACVSVGGSTSTGYCFPHCYVQAPDACSQYGNECLEKVDVKWHTGSCFGNSTPCDPAAQTGCDTGKNCKVVAGGAVGGHAFICGDVGSVAENGDCSGDGNNCIQGLICVSETCRAPCDPANDQCAAGTCEDISASYYLPANTIGACALN